MIWAGGRGGGTSHPGLALGKFLTHRLAGENRRFFKHPGKSECVSDLCDFLTRTSFVQSKSLTTPPIRTTKDASPCILNCINWWAGTDPCRSDEKETCQNPNNFLGGFEFRGT